MMHSPLHDIKYKKYNTVSVLNQQSNVIYGLKKGKVGYDLMDPLMEPPQVPPDPP